MPVVEKRLDAVTKAVKQRTRRLQATQEPSGLVVVLGGLMPLGGTDNPLGVHEQDESQKQLHRVSQRTVASVAEAEGVQVQMSNNASEQRAWWSAGKSVSRRWKSGCWSSQTGARNGSRAECLRRGVGANNIGGTSWV